MKEYAALDRGNGEAWAYRVRVISAAEPDLERWEVLCGEVAALKAELATEKEAEQGWVDALDAAQAELRRVEAENERLIDKVNLLVIRRDTLNRKRLDMEDALQEMSEEMGRLAEAGTGYSQQTVDALSAERDRYRDLLEKLAAGKFESGDHAQELAADTLGGISHTEAEN